MASTLHFDELLSKLQLNKSTSANLSNIAIGILLTWAAYCVGLVVYRLYIDPLSPIPGPKIAAATGWYEFYYDVIKRGQYIYKIEEMHKKYGPIIRINPYEVIINDADFYNEVYVAGNTRRTGIWPRYRKGIGFDGSHTMTANHELHRRRRKPLEPYFSRLGIGRMEPTIVDEAKLLSTRIEAMKGSKSVIRLDHVFSAFAGDVIGRICAETPPYMMRLPDFGRDWHDLIERIVGQLLLFMHIPELVSLARLIPTSVLFHLYPGASGFNEFRNLASKHIEDAKAQKMSAEQVDENATSSIFRHIISMNIPDAELSTERLSREAMVLFGAGTATTARTMGFMSYYLLTNPHMKERLTAELAPLMSDYPENLPKWADLEKLDYLQALIKEGLRLSYGVMRRLPRTSPDIALQYKQYVIPKDTPVGMAAYSLHTDPEVYPEPFKFIPERWLGDIDPRMHRNWVPFSRGSRNCLGINLAYAEMNWALATLFRPGGPDITIYETDESDIAQSVDFLMPLPKLDSRGTRVMVN